MVLVRLWLVTCCSEWEAAQWTEMNELIDYVDKIREYLKISSRSLLLYTIILTWKGVNWYEYALVGVM